MSFILWMTGLPCSGKTTIARKLQEIYPKLALLDGDELREWLSPKDFSRFFMTIFDIYKNIKDFNLALCNTITLIVVKDLLHW